MNNENKKFIKAGERISNHERNTKVASTKATRDFYNSPEFQEQMEKASKAIEIRKKSKGKKNMEAFWNAADLEDRISSEEKLLLKELKAVRNNFKILIVDDNSDYADMLRDIIKEECNFQNVDIAPDVDTALNKCSVTDYDLILSDYNMPGKNGYEFWEQLKDQNYNTNFVLISGYTPEQVRNLRAAGVLTFEKCMAGTESLFKNVIKITKGYYARKIQKMTQNGFTVKEAA